MLCHVWQHVRGTPDGRAQGLTGRRSDPIADRGEFRLISNAGQDAAVVSNAARSVRLVVVRQDRPEQNPTLAAEFHHLELLVDTPIRSARLRSPCPAARGWNAGRLRGMVWVAEPILKNRMMKSAAQVLATPGSDYMTNQFSILSRIAASSASSQMPIRTPFFT
jgi:hypothetical protein